MPSFSMVGYSFMRRVCFRLLDKEEWTPAISQAYWIAARLRNQLCDEVTLDMSDRLKAVDIL